MRKRYSFDVFEVGSGSMPTYTRTIYCSDPIKLARRWARFVNFMWSKPGGYDQVIKRIRIFEGSIWPNGERLVGDLRRLRQRKTRA